MWREVERGNKVLLKALLSLYKEERSQRAICRPRVKLWAIVESYYRHERKV